jgi:molecular chaperone DnaJ
MDAFFGGGAGHRGPAQPGARPARDAHDPIELDLDETVFGTTKDITVDTAVVCDACIGAGTAARHPPGHLRHCSGPR